MDDDERQRLLDKIEMLSETVKGCREREDALMHGFEGLRTSKNLWRVALEELKTERDEARERADRAEAELQKGHDDG